MAGRIIPITFVRRSWSIFDDFFHRMAQAEAEMDAIRRQMFRRGTRDVHEELSESCRTERRNASAEQVKPYVTEQDGPQKLKLTFDVQQFKPDEIKLKLLNDNMLQVRAEQHSETSTGYESRVFERRYSLPSGVDTSSIRSTLAKDGQLTVEADLPRPQSKASNEKILEFEQTA